MAEAAAHTAHITLPCGTAGQAEWVRQAIQSEADEAPDGATCRLGVVGSDLVAAIAADDVAGLRAAVNSVVRLADSALRTMAPGDGR